MLIELFVGAKRGGSWGERRKRWVHENNESNLAVQYREILCLRKLDFLNLKLRSTSIFLFFKKAQYSVSK